jgi:hypothetical protein
MGILTKRQCFLRFRGKRFNTKSKKYLISCRFFGGFFEYKMRRNVNCQ